METINQTIVPELQTFAKSNELGKEIFEALSTRERAAARSDIDAIFRELEAKHQKELNYYKFLGVWKMLEEKKLGTLVFGRKGNPNRFVWRTSLREVGRVALGLSIEMLPDAKKVSEPIKKAPQKPQEAVPNSITFVIPASVPMEEILALVNLGTQLAAKTLPENNKK